MHQAAERCLNCKGAVEWVLEEPLIQAKWLPVSAVQAVMNSHVAFGCFLGV